ncbi:23 kDa jasmonate-induced protein-like [Benincasa hispida]|uniref:23 kDa jasmonate-induced protein-like n=1 Tax=Benincasa hispida TaxID=102211 RepID=UPI00190227BD|nr:23 kDa jasmonate-induced protein-like [Benincasa hispida]
MICNIFGKAVTKWTVIGLPEYKNYDTEINRVELATVALAWKNSQGKGKEEEEALRSLEDLTARIARQEDRFTLGWIYNASGGAITLLDRRNGSGDLAASTLCPLRIENGQWGVFVHKQIYSESSGAVVYEGFDYLNSTTSYWCVAWKNISRLSSAQVHVKIGRDVDWCENEWNNVYKALERCGSLHRTKEEGWRSVISASPGPHVVFEALLTMKHL